jgi:hypothetical protein
VLDGFPDRFRNLVRLAESEADRAVAVADNDERAEAEAPAAFHNLRDSVHVDQFFFDFIFGFRLPLFFESRHKNLLWFRQHCAGA